MDFGLTPPPILRLLAVALSLLAGGGLYLAVVNRTLSRLRDGINKGLFLLGSGALFMAASVLYGLLAAPLPGLVLPAAVLLLLALAEVRSLFLSRALRGSPPLSADDWRPHLLHPITTSDLRRLHYEVACPGWPAARLRVAHLSDFHLNHYLPGGYYQSAIARANACEPDLVLLTGDFVTDREHITRLPELLRGLQARLGVYAAFGNHDYWSDPDQIEAALQAAGVQRLQPGGCRLEVRPGAGDAAAAGVVLTACERPWSAICDSQPAATSDLHLVLSHTADNVYALNASGAAAVFSGHYHAGQLCLPWLGPIIIPSRYGRRFAHGHFLVNGTHLFVTAGIGANTPALRTFCPPDFFVIDFLGNGAV